MRTSESIANLSAAMALAQGKMKPAIKDATNPHFKSKYADLSSVFEAVRAPFAEAGLSVWQELGNADGGVTVSTRLVHKSGEWVEFGPLFVPAGKQDAQGLGSAATYARRYGLASALGVCADEDDDGNLAAQGGGKLSGPKTPAPAVVSWTIKADGPDDFCTKFIAKVSKAPTMDAIGKLEADNKANIEALAEDKYPPVRDAISDRVKALTPAQAAE